MVGYGVSLSRLSKTHFTHERITIGPAFDARKPFRNFHFIVPVSLLILRVPALAFLLFVFPFSHCHAMVIMHYSLFILPNHVHRAAAGRKSSSTFSGRGNFLSSGCKKLSPCLRCTAKTAFSSLELLKNSPRTITGDTITLVGRS